MKRQGGLLLPGFISKKKTLQDFNLESLATVETRMVDNILDDQGQ